MAGRFYDVVVVGGGHAGIEAALAACRLGARTALVTGNLDTIGKMSCNPAIGGTAKGQLVREIDALGGAMGEAADACGIHFRRLGTGKGPAMWSPRAQCDKAAYGLWMKHRLECEPGLHLTQGDVCDLETDADQRLRAVWLHDGRRLECGAVVLATGTFLAGETHQGELRLPAGRMGDPPSLGLSDALRRLGLTVQRMKTGTPPRVHADTVDYTVCEPQPGEEPLRPFSFASGVTVANRVTCWICHTSPEAHAVIRSNLHRAPMYNGQISSVGPRYCPSIETKVERFADRQTHQLFLEPEGVATREMYVNGLSTSLPVAVQDEMLAAIPALRHARVLRYAYAIEYDMVATDRLERTLAVRGLPGLYLAGQINGTSGYEEAAAQGLLAGANAALWLAGREALVVGRAEGYLGVLVDDLVVRRPDEPYRMFTSRAEHRLHLRADNADRRLTPLAGRVGLVEPGRAEAVARKAGRIAAVVAGVPPDVAGRIAGEAMELEAARALVPGLTELPADEAEGAWIDLRYAGYVERALSRIERLEKARALRLPADLDYVDVPALSSEARRVLAERRPATLDAAGRLAGVRESDLENLWAWMTRRGRTGRDVSGR